MVRNEEMTPDMKVFVIQRGGGLNDPILPQEVLNWATEQRSPHILAEQEMELPKTFPGFLNQLMIQGPKNMTKEAYEYWLKKMQSRGPSELGPATAPTTTVMDAPESNEIPEQESIGSGAVRNWQERNKIMQELKEMGI